MLHFAIKNANSKIKSKNSLWAKNKKIRFTQMRK